MAQNLIFDPVKKDYVVENGSPLPSDRVLEAAYYALLIPQGKWIYGEPSQGSLLYKMLNQKRKSSSEQQFSSIVKEALDRQLVKTGIASGTEFITTETTRTGTAAEIKVAKNEQLISDEFSFDGV